LKSKFGLYTAISIVIANMIGTGIFTSLGFQVLELKSGFALLFLWLLGGISSLIGAMAYAELGTSMPRSGGEYHFLSRIYHPALGFVSGWVSFIVGFAAPAAAAATALSAYLMAALDMTPGEGFIHAGHAISIAVIIVLSLLHARSKRAGAGFQNVMTSLKIGVLVLFILIGLFYREGPSLDFEPHPAALKEIISPAFAIAIFFVSFAYSGWNAAAYIIGEMDRPGRNIPLSLILGTGTVTLLYIGITYVFLKVIPMGTMAGKIEIGYLFGQEVLGVNAGRIMGGLFSLMLFSTVSSLVITGPRVTQVMGEDYPAIKWFSATSRQDTPVRAIYIQAGIAIVYLVTSTFEQMITYIGFTLNLMTLLTVLGMMLNRGKKTSGIIPVYRIRPYPLLPLIFLLINTWIMVYGLLFRPMESIAGLITAAVGFGVWYWLRQKTGDQSQPPVSRF
jgi:APA family basic amino acid/polyamine antiporter